MTHHVDFLAALRTRALISFVSLLAAAPLGAQQFGTIEFGGFGSTSSMNNAQRFANNAGGGMRLGFYLSERLQVEMDGNTIDADRPVRSRGVHRIDAATVPIVSVGGRVTWAPMIAGPLSLLVGGGMTHTEYMGETAWGMSALVGARLRLTPWAAARVDVVADDVPSANRTNIGVRFGINLFRSTSGLFRNTRTVAKAPETTPAAVPAAN